MSSRMRMSAQCSILLSGGKADFADLEDGDFPVPWNPERLFVPVRRNRTAQTAQKGSVLTGFLMAEKLVATRFDFESQEGRLKAEAKSLCTAPGRQSVSSVSGCIHHSGSLQTLATIDYGPSGKRSPRTDSAPEGPSMRGRLSPCWELLPIFPGGMIRMLAFSSLHED